MVHAEVCETGVERGGADARGDRKVEEHDLGGAAVIRRAASGAIFDQRAGVIPTT